MAQRWPNTTTWKLVERTFRAVAGPSWRRFAAAYLGVDRSDLRAAFDRDDMTGDELDAMHAAMRLAVDLKLADLKVERDAVRAANVVLLDLENERYTERRRIELEASDEGKRYSAYIKKFIAELEEA